MLILKNPDPADDLTPMVEATKRWVRGADRFTGPLTAVIVALIGVALVHRAFTLHSAYQTSGFDLGIFMQGTWLLAHGQDPFSTLRGLNLFGDHASYILGMIAPLYRLWPDARLLLGLQVVALLVPAAVIYRFGVRRQSRAIGSVSALAYVLLPAVQWPAVWQFHPETFAAAFLALAIDAFDRRSDRWLGVWIVLALLCKEDVSFVAAGFGLVVFLSGQRRLGVKIITAALLYFVTVVFIVTPLLNGSSGSVHFQRNYGIDGSGLLVVLGALPMLLARAARTLASNDGLSYLVLVVGPFLALPFLGGRWLLPAAGPLLLNLASNTPYQRGVEYQYLVTSAPFLAVAAVMGLQRLRQSGMSMAPVLMTLFLVSGFLSYTHGPGEEIWKGRHMNGADATAYRDALALIPNDAVVSAEFDMNPHLSNREAIYEFPNPFRNANWGVDDTERTSFSRINSVEYTVANQNVLEGADLELFTALAASPVWQTVFDRDGVLVLRRIAPDPLP